MTITCEMVAQRIIDMLHHQTGTPELVDWAESVILEGDFDAKQAPILREVIGRIGLADVRSFGLTWDDCESLLKKLGYRLKIEALAEA